MLRTGLAAHLLAVAMVLGPTASIAAAQAASEMCWAPSQWDSNLRVPSFVDSLDRKAAMERMRDSLVGQYRFITVMTEGAERRYVSESRLVFSARQPIDTLRRIGYAADVIADGVAHLVREGEGGRLRKAKDTAAFHLRLHYSPPDHLTIRFVDVGMPDLVINDDPRPIYDVIEIDSAGALIGRWTGGGIAGAEIVTDAGRLGEMPAGYFCAFRLRRK
jgi:hypothetical protein